MSDKKFHETVEKVFQPKSSRLDQLARLWSKHEIKPEQAEPVGPGEESVWSYPRPPAVVFVKNKFSVFLNGKKILQAEDAIKVMETASPPTYYFAREALLCQTDTSEKKSHCEWKGVAHYLHFIIDEKVYKDVAWYYATPFIEYPMLKGLISLYPSKFDVFIGEEKVRAQDGDFYGGWITSEIKGPFKGDPGTETW